MDSVSIEQTLSLVKLDKELQQIARKVLQGERLTPAEGVVLFKEAELGFLGVLANFVREKHNGNQAFFNKNFHIEPTNVCVFNCRFCSYRRRMNEYGAWETVLSQVEELCRSYQNKDVTEVHIVGGVHPNHDLQHYANLVRKVREILPFIHIKAFSAVELDYMFTKAGLSAEAGFKLLKEAGLNSIPGGGAEIFDETLRSQICPDKVNAKGWLAVHEAAHKTGLLSNATMLYGHIETYEHRIDHLTRLRDLQDKTQGFNCFIPLKYRKANNSMSSLGEVTLVEDLRNYAVSRIYLDNFRHMKGYWPMIGKDMAQLSLSFGVDDIDGTIDDTTKIYTMAGVEEQTPSLTTDELVSLIRKANRIPVERNSNYQPVKTY
jgi:aminodeoxyfutalosine synthase